MDLALLHVKTTANTNQQIKTKSRFFVILANVKTNFAANVIKPECGCGVWTEKE